MSKTLIIGLGNPILGDDGAGWKIAGQISLLLSDINPEPPSQPAGFPPDGLSPDSVEIDCLSVGGLGLMERMIGYDRAILVDAIFTGKDPAGTVSCFPLEALPDLATGHFNSAHDASLKQAIQVGRSMGACLPDAITIVAVDVEAENLYQFSDELSPPVAAAVPEAVQAVLGLLINRKTSEVLSESGALRRIRQTSEVLDAP